jgi:hypothetical protein
VRAVRFCAAVVVGLVLGALPFVRYVHLGPHEPHADHEPRHGGQLGMVGDHHVELVRTPGRIAVFVSDARRRPVTPLAGSVVVDGVRAIPLVWRDHRLAGAGADGVRRMDVVVELAGGAQLRMGFDG